MIRRITQSCASAQWRASRFPSTDRIPAVLYGSAYWNEVINFEALGRHGVIDRHDLALFRFADDRASALALLQSGMAPTIGLIPNGRLRAFSAPALTFRFWVTATQAWAWASESGIVR